MPAWQDLVNVGLIMMVWVSGLLVGWFLWGKSNGRI